MTAEAADLLLLSHCSGIFLALSLLSLSLCLSLSLFLSLFLSLSLSLSLSLRDSFQVVCPFRFAGVSIKQTLPERKQVTLFFLGRSSIAAL